MTKVSALVDGMRDSVTALLINGKTEDSVTVALVDGKTDDSVTALLINIRQRTV